MYDRSLFTLSLILVLFAGGCSSEPDQSSAESEDYQQAVSDFYVSLAASETEEARFAFNKMNEVATAFPEETAAWANLGVMAMRQGNFELADERLEQARDLAPENSQILFLSALFESRRGNIDLSVGYMRDALDVESENPRIQFALIEELERQDDTANEEEILQRIRQLGEQMGDNQAVSFETVRVAAKYRDTELLQQAVDDLSSFSSSWDEDARELFEVVQDAAADEAYSDLNFELSFLRNSVEPTPGYLADLREVQMEPNQVGFLITSFLELPQPDFRAASPDLGISFSDFEESELPGSTRFVKAATLLEESPPFAVYEEESSLVLDSSVKLPIPVGNSEDLSEPQTIAEIDYNYNFRNDIAMAGDEGFLLYEQNDDQTFTDVTETLGLSSTLTNQAYRGVWPADPDLDGDLDLVLAPESGGALMLRNNADGTFTETDMVPDFDAAVTGAEWADYDNDGSSDVIFLTDNGNLVLFRNERAGQLVRSNSLPDVGTAVAFTVSDIDANGTFDIIALDTDGTMHKIFYRSESDDWASEELFSLDEDRTPGESTLRLFSADMDNNGSLDLIISSSDQTGIWLSDSELEFTNLDLDLPGGLISIFDINGNDRLDLLGLNADGAPYQLINTGQQNYNARLIRARASGEEGDRRINSFGIGGEMEVRSGLLYQKQRIQSPIVHFGLGEKEEADMLRIIWPNGSVQAEFAELGMGSTIFNEQVLKGSCPWLFTHDGDEMHFVTDILWRSPLGLRINAQETAGVIQTLDRVKIPGNLLESNDGVYDLRITAELWETHFFDHVSLVAVDHPEDTEIFVDERFVFPAPDLSTTIFTEPKSIKSVIDQNDRDWTATVSERNESYMKPFKQTTFQGIVEDHYVEIDLGEDLPKEQSLQLIAHGWLKPTDSSLNLALSQGTQNPPAGLRVEVADGEGGWKELHENYGTPAGKTKTILIDLEDSFEDHEDHRVRLHTTSEIYWDSFHWAAVLSPDKLTERELAPQKMDLRYRGYSEWVKEDETSPMLPVYDNVSSTNQRWRDLIGYHTRFGDVTELLGDIDDRYVIMNAGDEILLEFEDPGKPEPGYTRSFVFVSDGWVKDGDYNTEASKTVTPLPYHGQTDYEYGTNSDLRSDPVFQRHRQDWVDYHTRFVTPESFRQALLFENE